jgi:hypothetical protein
MRRVLDQHRAGRAGHAAHRRQVADIAAQMHRQDGLHRPIAGPRQGLGQRIGRHQAGMGIDVGEHHLGPDIAGAVGGRQEGDRRRDADIALAPTPSASMARCRVAVPLATAMACSAPTFRLKAVSKASTVGPVVRKSARRAAETAATSSSSMVWRP